MKSQKRNYVPYLGKVASRRLSRCDCPEQTQISYKEFGHRAEPLLTMGIRNVYLTALCGVADHLAAMITPIQLQAAVSNVAAIHVFVSRCSVCIRTILNKVDIL